MDKQAIHNLLNKSYSNSIEIRDGIYLAVKEHNNIPFLKAYIDTTGALFNEDFDFAAYQRELLIDEYYSNEGAIQWNYYFYFLVDDKDKSKKEFAELKASVESDRKLARKFVITISEFEALLNPISSGHFQAPKDIEHDWYRHLTVGFNDDVFDLDIPFADVVTRYIEKKSTSRASRKAKKLDVTPFERIGTLVLNKYRPFPLKRKFHFGKVNLIHGPNAVGKTSLLEAIELSICGKTLRNKKNNEKFEFGITKFATDKETTYTNKTDSYYRSCDYHWYKQNYRSDNKLYQSFNRFNYFDADAAALFTERIEKNQGGMKKSLAQILYGVDTLNLFERIEKIAGRFHSEESRLSKSIIDSKLTIATLKRDLAKYTDASLQRLNNEALIKEIKSAGVKDQWLSGNNLNDLVDATSKLDVSLASWSIAIETYDVTDIKSIDKKIQDMERVNSMVNELGEQLRKIHKNKMDLEEKLRLANSRKSNLKRLEKYYAFDALQIKNLESNLVINERNLRVLQDGVAKFSKINQSLIQDFKNNSIDEALTLQREKLVDIENLRNKNLTLIDDIRNHQNEVSILLKQIQVNAKKLTKANPHLSDCPLCGSDLKPSTLLNKMLMNPEISLDNENLHGLVETSSELLLLQTETEKIVLELELLRDAFISLDVANKTDWDIKTILDKFLTVSSQVSELSAVIGKSKDILASLKGEELFSKELDQLMIELGYKNVNELPSSLNNQISENLETINSLDEQLRIVEAAILDNTSEYLNVTMKCFPLGDVQQSTEIKGLIDNLKNLQIEILKISTILDFNDLEVFSSVLTRISLVKKLITSYQDNQGVISLMSNLESRLLAAQKNYDELDKKINRSKSGIKELSSIIENYSPDKYLTDFLKSHTDTISEIFIKLHAPNDFIAVELIDDVLKLKRAENNYSGLEELSTGQRTALVLSVFLTLNQSIKTVPPIVIFDDPVTFVDDLNTLTFLDYLRNMVLNEEKQIFFATANQKLANLFAKKFEFLAHDVTGFKEFQLSRVEEVNADVNYA